jgi:hypothetical protein
MIEDFLKLPAAGMAAVVFTLLGAGVFVVGFVITVFFQYYVLRMLLVLERLSPDTLRHVTSVGAFGPWCSNPLRLFQFLRGSDFDSDSVVGPLKAHCRTWFRRWLRVFAVFGVILGLDAVAVAILAITHHG